MDLTTYTKNKIVNNMLRNTAWTPPATVYLALFTTATDDAGGGMEMTGGSYARQAVTFAAPTNGESKNSGSVTFTDLPASTMVSAAIMDASTGGNMLAHKAHSRTFNANDDWTLATNEIVVTID